MSIKGGLNFKTKRKDKGNNIDDELKELERLEEGKSLLDDE